MKKRKRKNPWVAGDGGCNVGDHAGDYPCDNDFENTKTGERVSVTSTMDAHFALYMEEFRSLTEIEAYEGVGEVRRMNPGDPRDRPELAHLEVPGTCKEAEEIGRASWRERV